MKISTKGRYALRMLVDLAEHREEGYIALKDIANRGNQGGYMLAKPPAGYTVGEILRLTEGDFAPVACVGKNPEECVRSAECPTLPVWQGLYKVITEYLDGITLQDIIDQQNARSIDNYMI